jgi:hypothetical protein
MGRIHFLKEPPVYHVSIKWKENLDTKGIYKLKFKFLRLIQAGGIQLQCFVIMSNHMHFMAHATDEDLIYIQENISGDFWRKQVRSWNVLKETYRYILRNPVEAGMVRQVEDYAFSSIRHIINYEEPTVFIYDPMYFHLNAGKVLNWLNDQEQPSEFYFN